MNSVCKQINSGVPNRFSDMIITLIKIIVKNIKLGFPVIKYVYRSNFSQPGSYKNVPSVDFLPIETKYEHFY